MAKRDEMQFCGDPGPLFRTIGEVKGIVAASNLFPSVGVRTCIVRYNIGITVVSSAGFTFAV